METKGFFYDIMRSGLTPEITDTVNHNKSFVINDIIYIKFKEFLYFFKINCSVLPAHRTLSTLKTIIIDHMSSVIYDVHV